MSSIKRTSKPFYTYDRKSALETNFPNDFNYHIAKIRSQVSKSGGQDLDPLLVAKGIGEVVKPKFL